MSEAGTAIFNHDIVIADDAYIGSSSDTDAIQIGASELTVSQISNFLAAVRLDDAVQLQFGTGQDGSIYVTGDDFYIDQTTSDKDIIFKGTDGASDITALTLDMSEAGKAIFNAGATFGAEVAMGTNKITGVGDPTAAQDVATKTYVDNTARFFVQTTGAIKLLANNNWAGFNRTTGGLDSSGFWNVDTGSGTIGTAYSYYGSYRNTFFTVPYAGKLTRMVLQGANTTNSQVGQDWNIHLAKSPVVDDSDSISWAAVTAVTKTLPDNRDKRFIYDIPIDQNCSQFDTFLLAFQGTNSADTWLSMNVILEFEYTLT
jgi:hypothetical protein